MLYVRAAQYSMLYGNILDRGIFGVCFWLFVLAQNFSMHSAGRLQATSTARAREFLTYACG